MTGFSLFLSITSRISIPVSRFESSPHYYYIGLEPSGRAVFALLPMLSRSRGDLFPLGELSGRANGRVPGPTLPESIPNSGCQENLYAVHKPSGRSQDGRFSVAVHSVRLQRYAFRLHSPALW